MRQLASILVLVAPLVGTMLGCAGAQRPCLQAGECGAKQACVAGTCRRSAEAPVRVSARRLVLEPEQVALVSSRSPDAADPTEIPFGRDAAGQVVLLLRFAAPFSPDTDVQAAYLVFEPVPDTTPSASPVPLSIARILSPWSAADSSWERLPRLSPIERSASASTWGQRVLRIDVTAMVRRWREHRTDDQGLAVLASPQDAFGARYELGTGRGRGPVLDVYLR